MEHHAMDSNAFDRMQNHVTDYDQHPDDVLVLLCQAGDNQAFAELMKRNQSTATKLALSILHDRQDAEDEVQNAFWKAFEHIGQFQRDAKFSTWLTRIVVNQCLMRLRQTRRARFYYLDDAVVGEDVMTLDLPDQTMTPEQQLAQHEISDVLVHEIQRIPPLLRNVFLLRDVEQRPMEEVAGRLGISVAAAKSRLLRARSELRSRLKKHCGQVGPATLFAS
jgi:RNA polymerase sigma-70 factor, ECF subfamily